MKVCFINPPFKAEYGKFSRESRSPSIGHSGVLYYPLWLIYAACVAEKNGFDVAFIDAPAKQMNKKQTLERVKKEAADAKLFVFDTSLFIVTWSLQRQSKTCIQMHLPCWLVLIRLQHQMKPWAFVI